MATRKAEIIELHSKIVASLKRSVKDAIRIGELLDAQKEEIGHGKFLGWIESEMPFKKSTAENYMKLWIFRDKIPTVGNLQKALAAVKKLENEEAQIERARVDALIAEKERTGEKPKGWNKAIEAEETKRKSDAEYKQKKEAAFKSRDETPPELNIGLADEPKQKDRVEELLERWLAEDVKNEDLELDDMRANVRQGKVFTVLKEYIDSFDGVSRQLEATYNLMRYLKRVAIELQPQTQVAS